MLERRHRSVDCRRPVRSGVSNNFRSRCPQYYYNSIFLLLLLLTSSSGYCVSAPLAYLFVRVHSERSRATDESKKQGFGIKKRLFFFCVWIRAVGWEFELSLRRFITLASAKLGKVSQMRNACLFRSVFWPMFIMWPVDLNTFYSDGGEKCPTSFWLERMIWLSFFFKWMN